MHWAKAWTKVKRSVLIPLPKLPSVWDEGLHQVHGIKFGMHRIHDLQQNRLHRDRDHRWLWNRSNRTSMVKHEDAKTTKNLHRPSQTSNIFKYFHHILSFIRTIVNRNAVKYLWYSEIFTVKYLWFAGIWPRFWERISFAITAVAHGVFSLQNLCCQRCGSAVASFSFFPHVKEKIGIFFLTVVALMGCSPLCMVWNIMEYPPCLDRSIASPLIPEARLREWECNTCLLPCLSPRLNDNHNLLNAP